MCSLAAVAILFVAACSSNAPSASNAAQSASLAPLSVKLAAGTAANFHYSLTLRANSAYRSLSTYSASGGQRRVRARLAGFQGASFFPADLSNDQNNEVVKSAESHNVYINCKASCWGDPEGFLRNLGTSPFIHIVDQYVVDDRPNRYTLGPSYSVTRTILNNRLEVNELLGIVEEASAKLGTGYGHIYHLFLPQGVDTCVADPNGTNNCYSPDNEKTWQFCAYHVSVDLPNNSHVLYTVEPYQNVGTCAIASSAGSGPLENSTDSSLSHELFETITDPDVNAWVADAQAVQGQEIADLCGGKNFLLPLGGRTYRIQLEYSNDAHACMEQPPPSPSAPTAAKKT